jgi:hypothetical protein
MTEAEPPQSARGQTTGRLAATGYGGPKPMHPNVRSWAELT